MESIVVNNLYFIPGIVVVAVVAALVLVNWFFDSILG